nr:actin cytoskeleton-regulatory complex protein pan1-like [Lolium perenne]
MQVEATGDSDAPDQQEAAGDSEAPDQKEDAGDKEESILGNLSPTSDNASTMNTEEYNKAMKEFEDEEVAEAESAPPKQVLATITGLEQEGEEETPTGDRLLAQSTSETPPSRLRFCVAQESGEGHISGHTEYMTADELVEQAGRGAIAHSEILNKPITPDDAADREALEVKRKEMLATAKVFANTAAAMLEERQEAGEVMEKFLKREREAATCLAEAKKLRAQWETMMADADKEADRIRREAIGPRKINFGTPSNQQPLATPKDNMKKAAEILAKKDEEIDIAHLRTLVASAMKQQSKTCERFPRIAAEALQGPIRKRALDKEDPDPHVAGNKHKMGRTHTSCPDLPSASANPPVVEHATPLEAMVGQEFLEKLDTRGQKKKAPAPEAGTCDAPPAKRSRKEVVTGKQVTTKRYRKREMPVASGPALKISKSATGMRPEGTEDRRAEGDFSSPPEVQDTGASNIGAGTEDAGRAEPLVPPVPEKTTTSTSSPSKSVPDSSAPANSSAAKDAPEAPAPPPAAPAGKPTTAKPTPPAQDPAAVVSTASSPSSGSRSLMLHASRAALVAGETASAQLGRITELTRGGADLGHLADYAEKWNRADLSPATLGLGKDKLPVIDPAGPRSTGQHFGRLRRAVKEFDNAWHDANHNVAVTVPEATVKALTDQLAALKAEKEQLAKEHQQALDAQRTRFSELKDKLMEAEVRHSQELKDAKAAAERKLDDTLKEFAHNSEVLRAELEEESKARKVAEGQIATLTTDQAAYDRLRGDAPTDTDPVLTAKRQDRAYRIAEFAPTQTFIPPPPGVRDEMSDDEEENAEDEEDEEAAEGEAPPEQGEAPEAGTQPPSV